MFKQRIRVTAVAAGLALATVVGLQPAGAQQYPVRPITAVVAAAAGGYADAVARIIADKVGSLIGQSIVIENRGGAAGNLGAKLVATAAPDGYTMLVTTTALAINETLYKNRGYTAADLKAVSIAASAPEVIVAHPSSPAKTVADLVKANKTITYGSAGVGTGSYIAAEYLFKVLAKVDTIHVPFPGGAPAINAILGNHIPVLAATAPPLISPITHGSLRGLGVASAKRMALLPDVPTYGEIGFPNFYAASWVGFFLPAKTDPKIVEKLNTAFSDALNDPAVLARLKPLGVEVFRRSTADTAAFFNSEVTTWGKMVTTLKMSVN